MFSLASFDSFNQVQDGLSSNATVINSTPGLVSVEASTNSVIHESGSGESSSPDSFSTPENPRVTSDSPEVTNLDVTSAASEESQSSASSPANLSESESTTGRGVTIQSEGVSETSQPVSNNTILTEELTAEPNIQSSSNETILFREESISQTQSSVSSQSTQDIPGQNDTDFSITSFGTHSSSNATSPTTSNPSHLESSQENNPNNSTKFFPTEVTKTYIFSNGSQGVNQAENTTVLNENTDFVTHSSSRQKVFCRT